MSNTIFNHNFTLCNLANANSKTISFHPSSHSCFPTSVASLLPLPWEELAKAQRRAMAQPLHLLTFLLLWNGSNSFKLFTVTQPQSDAKISGQPGVGISPLPPSSSQDGSHFQKLPEDLSYLSLARIGSPTHHEASLVAQVVTNSPAR